MYMILNKKQDIVSNFCILMIYHLNHNVLFSYNNFYFQKSDENFLNHNVQKINNGHKDTHIDIRFPI